MGATDLTGMSAARLAELERFEASCVGRYNWDGAIFEVSRAPSGELVAQAVADGREVPAGGVIMGGRKLP